MNQRVRQKIEAALAAKTNATLSNINAATLVADQVVSGEKVYTLEYVAARAHMDTTTAARKLRGKQGFLQHCVRGRITITESLFHSFIKEAASRGLQN
jgi:hypothetical protein